MNNTRTSKKHRIPMTVRTGLFVLLSFALAAGVFALLHSLGASKLFAAANAESRYLPIPEVDMIIASEKTPTPAPTATASPTASATFETPSGVIMSAYSTLRLGDENPEVASLQERLMSLGFMDYDEPGIEYNLSTQNAVKLFQRASNEEQTGIATNELQETLFSESAQSYRIKQNDVGADVKSLQTRLCELGYYDDRVTGFYGPNTVDAVLAFQVKNDMEPDGEVNRSDWEILYSGDAEPAVSTPSPSPVPTKTPKPTAKATPKATPKTTPKATPKATPNATPKATPKTTDAVPTVAPTASPTAASTANAPATPYIPSEDTPKPTVQATPTEAPTSSTSDDVEDRIDTLISTAKNQLGDPYVWGDEGPDSFDCSGLVYYCLRKAGVSIGRWNARNYSKNDDWKKISDMSDLKRGDLLFFCSDDESSVNHTAIYIGNEKFIHASSSKGEVVQSSFSSYWRRNFVCGRRVFE